MSVRNAIQTAYTQKVMPISSGINPRLPLWKRVVLVALPILSLLAVPVCSQERATFIVDQQQLQNATLDLDMLARPFPFHAIIAVIDKQYDFILADILPNDAKRIASVTCKEGLPLPDWLQVASNNAGEPFALKGEPSYKSKGCEIEITFCDKHGCKRKAFYTLEVKSHNPFASLNSERI